MTRIVNPKMKLVPSTFCCAQDNNLSEESTNQAETDAAGDVPNATRTENTIEKANPTKYLTRFGNLPTSSGQGGEIILIQQSIQTNTEGYLRELLGIQYMRALALIYSHRVLGF